MSRKRKINKRGLRRFLTIVAVVLASVTLCGFIVSISDGGENFFKPSEWAFFQVNEDNLYQQMTFAPTDDDGVLEDGRRGVTVTLTDDNTLKLKGEAEEDIDIVVATGTLKANTAYVFDSSLNDGSGKTIYMEVVASSGEVLAASYSSAVVIPASKLAADTNVSVKLYVKAEYDTGRIELKPILCEGETTKDLVDFYG